MYSCEVDVIGARAAVVIWPTFFSSEIFILKAGQTIFTVYRHDSFYFACGRSLFRFQISIL